MNTITALKNSLEVFDSRLNKAKQRIGEFKDRYFEINESEEQKKKTMEKKRKKPKEIMRHKQSK